MSINIAKHLRVMPERFKLDKLCIIKEVEKFLNPQPLLDVRSYLPNLQRAVNKPLFVNQMLKFIIQSCCRDLMMDFSIMAPYCACSQGQTLLKRYFTHFS